MSFVALFALTPVSLTGFGCDLQQTRAPEQLLNICSDPMHTSNIFSLGYLPGSTG